MKWLLLTPPGVRARIFTNFHFEISHFHRIIEMMMRHDGHSFHVSSKKKCVSIKVDQRFLQTLNTSVRTARKTQLPMLPPKIDVFKLCHKMTVEVKFQISDSSSSSFIAIMRIRNRDDGSRTDCFATSQLQMVRWTIFFL